MFGKFLFSTAKVVVLIGLTFYAGMLFEKMGQRYVYTYSDSGVSGTEGGEKRETDATIEFASVPQELPILAKKRAALRARIFGAEGAHSATEMREITVDQFKKSYISVTAFDKYFETLFASRAVSVSEVSGVFPEIQGYRWKSLLLHQAKNASNGRLFVYHHGHDGNPLNFRHSLQVLRDLMSDGYDVLVMSMPGVGWNRIENVRVKTWDGWGFLADRFENKHILFNMIDTGDAHFIKYFVGPVVSSIDRALSLFHYQMVFMGGHSGGGWTTTMSAALDDRIQVSVSYGGTLPFFAKRSYRDLGDAEQSDPSFYRDFTYPLLYELASSSASGKRVHYQLFNDEDDCCFDHHSTAALRDYLAARKSSPLGDFRVVIANGKSHQIDPTVFREILQSVGSRDFVAELPLK